MTPVERLRRLEQALETNGETPEVLVALARTWRKLGESRRAEGFVKRALQLNRKDAGAWNTLGAALMDQQRWVEAEQAFHNALRINPQTPHAESNLALALQQQCWQIHAAAQFADWDPYVEHGHRLLNLHRKRMAHAGEGLIAPFSVLGFHLAPDEHRAAAEAQASAFLRENGIKLTDPPPLPSDLSGRRIRVGYLSADFRDNAAGHLLHRLFAAHDRDRFEIFAFSYGPDDGSDFRRTIIGGVEHFVEGRELDDEALAEEIRSREIDLMVDLMGFAGNNRAGVLARRPAPRQVLWLGYCMTTGAPWIDAFLGDDVCLPVELEHSFSERIIRLPNSYQVYSGQPIESGTMTRADCGLPEDAFVYCCFNMPEKIDPQIFKRWMRVLEQVPGSVLWLLCGDEKTLANYRERAAAEGIEANRIIAAYVMPKKRHLARLQLADLFLDSPLCNAHTTASDALWAGVPVLTCPGRLFAQRVAASVCRAAGFPDLIVETESEYDRMAVDLGRDPQRLESLKAKLRNARDDAALFDVERFARDLERAFTEALQAENVSAETPGESWTPKLPVVMVLGHWRSGTSALAGALAELGFHLGTELAQLTGEHKHRNTWEAEDLIRLMWESYREPDVEPLKAEEEVAAGLVGWIRSHHRIAEAKGRLGVALKHPSLAMAAGAVRTRLPGLKTVRTERSIDEAWQSMVRAGWQWPEEAARKGLERQLEAAERACDGPVFAFPDYLKDPEQTVARLIDYLEIEPPEVARRAAIESLKPKN